MFAACLLQLLVWIVQVLRIYVGMIYATVWVESILNQFDVEPTEEVREVRSSFSEGRGSSNEVARMLMWHVHDAWKWTQPSPLTSLNNARLLSPRAERTRKNKAFFLAVVYFSRLKLPGFCETSAVSPTKRLRPTVAFFPHLSVKFPHSRPSTEPYHT